MTSTPTQTLNQHDLAEFPEAIRYLESNGFNAESAEKILRTHDLEKIAQHIVAGDEGLALVIAGPCQLDNQIGLLTSTRSPDYIILRYEKRKRVGDVPEVGHLEIDTDNGYQWLELNKDIRLSVRATEYEFEQIPGATISVDTGVNQDNVTVTKDWKASVYVVRRPVLDTPDRT